jgi:hypothetical protein
MKRIFVSAVALAAIALQSSASAERRMVPPEFASAAQTFAPAAGRIDGNDVVVRIYHNWRSDPASFEKVYVEARDCSIRIDSNEIDVNAVVAVLGSDQYESAVKKALENRVLAQVYDKNGIRLSLCGPSVGEPEAVWWTLTDALGNPVGAAEVQIYLHRYDGPRILLGSATVDAEGRLKALSPQGHLRQFCFSFRHPDYGIAEIDQPVGNETTIEIPFVSSEDPAYERAISVTIVDQQGRPVAGARINCYNIRTLGEGLIDAKDNRYAVISDQQGRFSLYMPNTKRRDERGYLIPPKSKYNVRIEAPKELGLLPYVQPIENGREAMIVMEAGPHFRRFVFADENGPITDTDKLRQICIRLDRPGKARLTLMYDDWKDGGAFPPGTYQATSSAEYEFEPLTLTDESPEALLFKVPSPIVYHGQVVHGLTGAPMQGALVIGIGASGKGNLSQITPAQWTQIHALPQNPAPDDEALALLQKIYRFDKVVRTDETGQFAMEYRPNPTLYGFVAFEENYLGLLRRKHALEIDRDGYAQVGAMKLYPAAKIMVEPCVDKKHVSILPRWIIDKQNNPPWVGDFLATDDRRESLFTYDKWLQQNKVQTFNIPSGLNLQIQLDTPYDRQWCPILVEQTINLAQGQVLDIGRLDFQPAVQIAVQVVNSAGQPLEGAPVRLLQNGKAWTVAHNSDESGISRFFVVPHSRGQFGVAYHSPDGPHLNEMIDWEIGGPEQAGLQFTLQLSDQMVYLLFK